LTRFCHRYLLKNNLTDLHEPDIAMRVNLLIAAGIVLAVCGLCTFGCGKKAPAVAKIDPHSPDGIMVALHDQMKEFNGALERKDFKYLHDYGYYFVGVIAAFNDKLDAGERKRLEAPIKELLSLTAQLDRAGGGGHAEATVATVKRMQEVLDDLDQRYQQGKQPR
jgi:hypothetical protein